MQRSAGPGRSGDTSGIEADHFESHRAELTAHCQRILRSPTEAQDAVQETLLRAWRGRAHFEGRASRRTWMYRIATNVCINELSRRRHRAESVARLAAADAPVNEPDPADLTIARDDLRHALDTVLGQLPPQQRAVLILREALRWPASDTAELLGVSVASVNSSLQRVRATLASGRATVTDRSAAPDELGRARASRVVEAFSRTDYEAVALALRDDARSA